MLPERCCTCLFLAATLPTRPRLSGCIQLNGPRRLVVAGAGRLLREQVRLVVAGVVCVVGVRKRWGLGTLCSKTPPLEVWPRDRVGSGAKPLSVLWRCPTLPHPPRCSTIGACGLSFQVRNGGWAFPRGYDHHKMVQPYSLQCPRGPACVSAWGFVLVVIRIVV